MSEAGWAGLLTAVHDTLFACDRQTRFALAGAERRLWLTVRAESVIVEIPPYDATRLTTLGWRAPGDGRDAWFYEVPRTVEHVDWLCRFAVHSASLMISSDPDTLTFRETDPDETDAPRSHAAQSHEARPDAIQADAEPVAPTGTDAEPADPVPADAEPVRADAGEAEPVVRPPALSVVPDPEPPSRSPEEALAALRAVLTEAVAARDLPAYLGALRGAAVCMPLLEDPSPETGVRPAVVRGADNAIFLPIFTSPDGLTEFAGTGVPFIALPFTDLIDDWPEPDWGLIVDPRTDRSLTLTAISLAELRAATPPVERLPEAAAG